MPFKDEPPVWRCDVTRRQRPQTPVSAGTLHTVFRSISPTELFKFFSWMRIDVVKIEVDIFGRIKNNE